MDNDWENPLVQARRRIPAHAVWMPYATAAQAQQAIRQQSPFYLSLNGEWDFTLAPNPASAPQNFHLSSFVAQDWARIQVPGNWQLQGYDIPYYTDEQLPFSPHRAPRVPEDANPTGCYRRSFALPSAWQGRQVRLCFDGVDSAFHVWVNGHPAGFSKDSRLPAEFDITPFLQPGENTLAVRVYRWSDGTYLENQDMWRLSGIFRDVYLWSLPALHLQDFQVHTDLDSSCRSGQFSLTLHFENSAQQPAVMCAAWHLLDASGRCVLQQSAQVLVAGQAQMQFSAQVPDVHPWSDEDPYLYRLLLSLQPDGGETEYASCAVGFRTVQVKAGQLLLNHAPVVIKGVNRHDHHPQTGHYVTEESMRRDLQMMKQFNINAIRTSHYPNAPRFYELCNEYGILVFAEANIECDGALAYLSDSPEWKDAFLARFGRMLACYRNHPSIIVWSLGNESGFGSNHTAMAHWARQHDPSRPVHYHPAGTHAAVDIIAPMYPSIEEIIALAQKPDHRPIILCEYAHSMGNATGNLKEYWDAFDQNPRLQGGFIWSWMDQGLQRITDGRIWYGYGGDFGDEPNDGAFCMTGLLSADASPHPALWEVKKCHEPVRVDLINPRQGLVRIHNRFFFANLNRFSVSWLVTREGEVVQSGSLGALDVVAQSSLDVHIPYVFPADLEHDYWLEIRFTTLQESLWAKAGHEVAWAQFQLQQGRNSSPLRFHRRQSAGLCVQESADSVLFTGADWQAVFQGDCRRLVSLQRCGQELIDQPPTLNFWRAPTDTDRGYGLERVVFTWKDAGLHRLQETAQRASLEHSTDNQARLSVHSRIAPSPANGRSLWYDWLLDQLLLVMTQTWTEEDWVMGGRLLQVQVSLDAHSTKTQAARAFLDACERESKGYDLLHFVAQRLDRLPARVFESTRQRLARFRSLSREQFERAFKLQDDFFIDCQTVYTLNSAGEICLETRLHPVGQIPLLPRIGWKLALPPAFDTFWWYGRGPLETYSDRRHGMRIGVYHASVDDLFFPYARPQETGNKTDVRWAACVDSRGYGLLVSAPHPFQAGALHYTAHDLENARHPIDLIRRPQVYLTLDFQHAGLGTASCGPGVLPQYTVPPVDTAFSIHLYPINPQEFGQMLR